MIVRPLNKSWTYVCKDEASLPVSEQTTFVLFHLSAAIEDEVAGLYMRGEAIPAMRLSLLHGLGGWTNLKDASGVDVQFKEGQKPMRCAVSNLDLIEQTRRWELATQIYAGAKVGAPEGN